ncbi:MAG: UDP-N-acetylmuramoyl-L-alanyl-D-glutamate--2,6-diaminopimelate ligase [Pseudomonadota bacterium]
MTINSGIGRTLEEFVPDSLHSNAQHNSEWSETRVSGLAVDSRKVRAGDCFIAYPGHVSDGRQFIAAAVEKGASAVLAEAEGLQVPPGVTVPVLPVPGLQQQLGAIASRFYGDPSQHVQLVAVTGTNGKTTVTQLIAQALQQLKITSGVMGTLGNGLAGQLAPTQNTTPDIIDINRLLHEMQQQNAQVVAMEASSHGLVQGRLDGLTLHTGIITNLSRDHLDYHGSMEAYRDAKALLARNHSLKSLILNADDAQVMGMAVHAQPGVSVMTFSLRDSSGATVVARNLQFHSRGMRLQVQLDAAVAELESALVGEFNASNLLAALAGLLSLGIALPDACKALGQVQPVPGRVEMVNPQKSAQEPAVVVDFAHTPDALEKVIFSLRRHCSGKLWCVFGCGGDRDAGKRPLMGAVVARDADEMIVTADNPRSEKLRNIIGHIVKGIPPQCAYNIIEDRAQAVEFAVLNAAGDDLILLAGKGHEDYQDVQGVKYPYSDLDVARQALQKRSQVKS